MAAEIRELLGTHPLFGELDPDVIDRIAGLSRPVTLSGDQTLFFKGDEGDALYGVRNGRIRISASDPEGKEIVINIMGPGDIFGEIALLDGRPRTADAMAMVPTELYQIRRADFVRLLEDEPELSTHLIELLCLRLRVTTELLEDSAFLSLPARLAKRLLALSEYSEATDAGERSIKISQAELGQLMGTSRESINKHLQAWRKEDWINLGRGRVSIVDPEALQDLVEASSGEW